jgi:hypothetical protein
VLRPEEDDGGVDVAIALGRFELVIVASSIEVIDDAAVAVVVAADVDDVTPMVAARTNVSPEEQQLFSASSPQHHDPSGHMLMRALLASP